MDEVKRLSRKPGSTAVWLTLLLLSALLLQLGFSLFYSMFTLAIDIEALYTTIAVPSDYAPVVETAYGEGRGSAEFTDEQIELLKSAEGVKQLDMRGFTTGWSGQLTPLSSIEDPFSYGSDKDGAIADTIIAGTVTSAPTVTERAGGAEVLEFIVSVDDIVSSHSQLPIPDELLVAWTVAKGHPEVEVPEVGRRYMIRGDFFAISRVRMEDYYSAGIDQPYEGAMDWLLVNDYFPATSGISVDELIALDWWQPTATVSRLEGRVEDFFAAPDNQLWRDALNVAEMGHQSVPVLGTECLDSVYQFNQKQARIVAGREFTDEEYESGSRVCVISDALAGNSGLSLGDTITMSLFGYDPFLSRYNYGMITSYQGKLINPLPTAYSELLGFLSENEEYTIVGIYRQENRWDDSSYAFTPNTVFIPAGAQPEGAYVCAGGTYLSVVIENGRAEEFLASLEGTELEGRFITFDQGYEAASAAVADLERSALRLFLSAALVWALVAALFLMLYQAREKRNIGIMRSLGASPARCRGYLFGSAAALVAVASLLGAAAAGALSGYVNSLVFSGALSGEASSEYGTALSAGLEELAAGLQSAAPGFGVSLLAAAVSAGILCLALYLQAVRIAKTGPRLLLGSAE